MGLSIPTRQEPRKALYVSPLADPLIAASGPEETMETSFKKRPPAPHRLSMLSEDKLLDRALKLLKKAVSEKQTRQQEQDVLCRFHLLVCVVF